jgi:hypothetical protein
MIVKASRPKFDASENTLLQGSALEPEVMAASKSLVHQLGLILVEHGGG